MVTARRVLRFAWVWVVFVVLFGFCWLCGCSLVGVVCIAGFGVFVSVLFVLCLLIVDLVYLVYLCGCWVVVCLVAFCVCFGFWILLLMDFADCVGV